MSFKFSFKNLNRFSFILSFYLVESNSFWLEFIVILVFLSMSGVGFSFYRDFFEGVDFMEDYESIFLRVWDQKVFGVEI